MTRGSCALSPRLSRNSATRFGRLASDTKVSGQRILWSSSFETAFGRRSIKTARSANAFGETRTDFPPRNTSRVSGSNSQSPNRRRIADFDEPHTAGSVPRRSRILATGEALGRALSKTEGSLRALLRLRTPPSAIVLPTEEVSHEGEIFRSDRSRVSVGHENSSR